MDKMKICPMITPFHNNKVDYEKMHFFGELILSKGIDLLFLCGTTGLGPTLSHEEKMKIMEVFSDISSKVIMQIGSLNTSEVVELAKKAKSLNFRAIALLPPYYYFDVPESWLIRYFLDVSRIYDTIVYNFPKTTNNPISTKIVKEVNAKGGRIIGIKETLPDISHMINFKWEMGDDFLVLSGPDDLIIPALRSGLDGIIGSSSNYLTDIFVRIIRNYEKIEAENLQKIISSCLAEVKKYGQWSANYTAIRHFHGLDVGQPRPPLLPLEPEQERELVTSLHNITTALKN
ncbi:MAG: dihydrodipicolinate synthase family protein [Candidatus Thermoplasmatota archaeon]|nr:dihydrodipicolinate synthase family protein [Candidatus Thermoplasmatota archaeon]